MRKSIGKLLKNQRVHQSSILYISLVLQLAFGITISILNTRILGPEHFGNLKYLQSVFSITLSCLTFGIFITSGNLMALEDEKNTRKFIGEMLPIVGFVGATFIIVIIVFLLLSRFIYNYDLLPYAKLSLPFLIALPLQIFFEAIFRGGNNIYRLAIMNCCPQMLYIILILVLWKSGCYTLDIALVTFLGSVLAVGLIVLWTIKPVFVGMGEYTRAVIGENKRIGFPFYLGVIITYVSSNLGVITLGFYQTPIEVGVFALATTVTMPISMIPNVIATTYYKDFVKLPGLPIKVSLFTIWLTALSLLGFVVVINPLFICLYGKEYGGALKFVYYMAIGFALHGLGDYVSRYLLATNKSRQLLIVSSFAGLVNISGYIGLVNLLGLSGAVMTKIAASSVYLCGVYWFYIKRDKINKSYILAPV